MRDSKLSRGCQVGVDFGCKGMKNRRLFKTKEYYGVDIDRSALDEGLARYPDAKAVHARIEQADTPLADFALCIHVFATMNFVDSDSMEVVRALVSKIAPDGTLLMSLKNNRKNVLYDLPAHVALLREAFHQVDVMSLDIDNTRSRFAYLKAKYHLYRRPKVIDPMRIYCRCVGRKQV